MFALQTRCESTKERRQFSLLFPRLALPPSQVSSGRKLLRGGGCSTFVVFHGFGHLCVYGIFLQACPPTTRECSSASENFLKVSYLRTWPLFRSNYPARNGKHADDSSRGYTCPCNGQRCERARKFQTTAKMTRTMETTKPRGLCVLRELSFVLASN